MDKTASATITNICAISIAAILGVLTRTSVNLLFGPTRTGILSVNDILFADLASNFLGCFVLGCHVVVKERVTIPEALALAISTGYAGSVTTFASWNYQIVRMFSRGLWLEALGGILVGMCLSFCAFIVGRDVGVLVLHALRRQQHHSAAPDEQERNLPSSHGNKDVRGEGSRRKQTMITLSVVCLFLAGESLTIVGAALDRGNPTRRAIWASALYAPVGATLRWRLSFFNRRMQGFPVGTFIANMIAMLYDVAIGATLILWAGASSEARLFLNASIAGLGGSLSTVSTWVGEAFAMKKSQRYMYVVTSIVCAQLLGIAVYGTTFWLRV